MYCHVYQGVAILFYNSWFCKSSLSRSSSLEDCPQQTHLSNAYYFIDCPINNKAFVCGMPICISLIPYSRSKGSLTLMPCNLSLIESHNSSTLSISR